MKCVLAAGLLGWLCLLAPASAQSAAKSDRPAPAPPLTPALEKGGKAGSPARELAEALAGSFANHEQIRTDPSYSEVHVQVVAIWPLRDDGPWLYAEQAMATAPERPYRQQVFHLLPGSGEEVIVSVYDLPGEPARYAGSWRHPRPLAELAPERLVEKPGCRMILRRQPDGSFHGGTTGRGCPSALRGASYCTTELTVSAEVLKVWDRGFDKDDKQVWGAVKGPYVFKKLNVKRPKK